MTSESLALCPPSPIISQRHQGSTPTPLPSLLFHAASPPLSPTNAPEAVSSKEERTGPTAASHWPKGLDIIYLYLHCLLLGGEGGSRVWRVGKGWSVTVQKCLLRDVSYRYFIFTIFLMAAKQEREETVSAIGCKWLCMIALRLYGQLSGFKCAGHSRLLSHRVGCQTPSPQWSVGKGGGR